MKRLQKLALIPAAVAATLAGNAYAGTSACFEVYKTADDGAVTAHQKLYRAAECQDPRSGASETGLAALDLSSVAYELTKNYGMNLNDVNSLDEELQLVYIPTTNLPSGTVLKFRLTGDANWGTGNANQMHLIQVDQNGIYREVATSDGTFNEGKEITFVVKAGVSVQSGSRLVWSRSVAADGQNATPDANGTPTTNAALIESPYLNIETSESCSEEYDNIGIEAFYANVGGVDLIGAKNKQEDFVEIKRQFTVLKPVDSFTMVTIDGDGGLYNWTSGSTGNLEDNLSEVAPRTRFIDGGTMDRIVQNVDMMLTDPDGEALPLDIDRQAYAEAAVFPFVMKNDLTLDGHITLDPQDDVHVRYSVDGVNMPSAVDVSLWHDWTGDNATPTNLITATPAGWTYSNPAGTTDIIYDADEIFGGADEVVYAKLQNVNDGIMNFNYNVMMDANIDFEDETFHDVITTSCVEEKAFEVGVDGAVLKVPYTYDTGNNWVRITNESDSVATITADIFDESGNVIKAVQVGSVAGKASTVLRANEVIKAAKAAGYTGTGFRHTMTFNVAAPKDEVHGVSVQNIPGGVDRVLPVLDQNSWNQ
ncbi:hypothetical protein EXT46_14820 [Pseudoalteromonas sp. CO325X]|uniref:hypothetical protein n=1 Tax=Pseudoalteromonas sp. CO325X TaxID=1777262 RepID=UPI00102333A2|nr:hypothetical protein [Pseudoalteromonas sp. CO325X]RZF79162.1 hypothetical protein EXT46_14820 [Pseudoalteromonas sp. CO325X]